MTDEYGREETKAATVRRAAHQEILRLRASSGVARTIVRFVYYRLVARRIVAKDDRKRRGRRPSQEVSEGLTWLRNAGLVEWSEIVDEFRSVIDATGFASIGAGLYSYVGGMPLDPWDGDPPALVVESKSLAAFLRPTAYTYRVPLIPLGGQSSAGFLANEVAHLLGPKTEVLYVGDYDKAGGDIEQSATDRLCEFAPDWCGEWTRIAVTDEQAERYAGLTIEKPDNRFRPPRWFRTLEAEAIDQHELTAAVTDALDAVLPVPLDEIEDRERRERDVWRARLARWQHEDEDQDEDE